MRLVSGKLDDDVVSRLENRVHEGKNCFFGTAVRQNCLGIVVFVASRDGAPKSWAAPRFGVPEL